MRIGVAPTWWTPDHCTIGIAAAVAGGWFDLVATRVVDAVMAFPSLILALIVLSVLGTSIPVLVAVMAVLASTVVFRLRKVARIHGSFEAHGIPGPGPAALPGTEQACEAVGGSAPRLRSGAVNRRCRATDPARGSVTILRAVVERETDIG